MTEISITTTATLRPEVLHETYSSFFGNLKDINLCEVPLYINIDPAPRFHKKKKEKYINKILSVANSFFKKISTRIPLKPNYTIAQKWLWENADSEYILNIEDDWALIKSVSYIKIKEIFNENKSIRQVRFTANFHGNDGQKYGTSPCVMKREFADSIAKILKPNLCPEWQMRRSTSIENQRKEVRCYPKEKIVTDIGEQWRDKKKLFRPPFNKRHTFVKWRQK